VATEPYQKSPSNSHLHPPRSSHRPPPSPRPPTSVTHLTKWSTCNNPASHLNPESNLIHLSADACESTAVYRYSQVFQFVTKSTQFLPRTGDRRGGSCQSSCSARLVATAGKDPVAEVHPRQVEGADTSRVTRERDKGRTMARRIRQRAALCTQERAARLPRLERLAGKAISRQAFEWTDKPADCRSATSMSPRSSYMVVGHWQHILGPQLQSKTFECP